MNRWLPGPACYACGSYTSKHKEGSHGSFQDHRLHCGRSFWRSSCVRHSRVRRALVARAVMAAAARRKAQIPRVASSPAVGVSGRHRASRSYPVLALSSNTKIRPFRRISCWFRGSIRPATGAAPDTRPQDALSFGAAAARVDLICSTSRSCSPSPIAVLRSEELRSNRAIDSKRSRRARMTRNLLCIAQAACAC